MKNLLSKKLIKIQYGSSWMCAKCNYVNDSGAYLCRNCGK
jgi:hypothetical protein